MIHGGEFMIFISMARWKKMPTKEVVAQTAKLFEQVTKEGIKIVGQYWTLGRCDAIAIFEAKDEKTMMKAALKFAELFTTETLVAIPRPEAIKLVD